MSDTESGSSPTGQEEESTASGSFSTNGNDPTGDAVEPDGAPGESVVDGDAFLADLARAMQTTATAEQARNAEWTEQRRQSHIDAIRAREAIEAEELRELAKEDVKGIDDWSDGEIKRIKLERERRIAARREQLQIRLEEHRTVIAQEVVAVEVAVAAYRADIEQYFRRLESETDPVAIAKQAGTRPKFPVLEMIGPHDVPVPTEFRHILSEASAPVDSASTDEGSSGDQDSGSGAGSGEPAIGTADAERSATLAQAPWASGSRKSAVEEPADATPVSDEATATEAPASDGSATTETPVSDGTTATEAPVSDGTTATEAPAGAEPAETDASAGDGTASTDTPDGAEEPVAAAADAKVVMPRSTGAGSWLRWPNKSDTGR
jgi:hypothetical protein